MINMLLNIKYSDVDMYNYISARFDIFVRFVGDEDFVERTLYFQLKLDDDTIDDKNKLQGMKDNMKDYLYRELGKIIETNKFPEHIHLSRNGQTSFTVYEDIDGILLDSRPRQYKIYKDMKGDIKS